MYRLYLSAHKHDCAVCEHLTLLVRREDAVAVVNGNDNVHGVGGVVAAAHLHCLHDERAAADARERLCVVEAARVADHAAFDGPIVVDVADTVDGAAARVIDDGGEAGL